MALRLAVFGRVDVVDAVCGPVLEVLYLGAARVSVCVCVCVCVCVRVLISDDSRREHDHLLDVVVVIRVVILHSVVGE
jgi:hypothetical protein